MTDQPFEQPPVVAPIVAPAPSAAALTPLGQRYLDQTRPWVRFMSVMTFLMAGFMLLIGGGMLALSVFGSIAAKSEGDLGPLGRAVGMGFGSVLYIAFALVYLAPGLYLYRYASAITRLKATSDAAALEDALKQQRSFWRYIGLVTVISLVMAVVLLVLAVVAGALAAAMAGRS